jgi:hypothetical protein
MRQTNEYIACEYKTGAKQQQPTTKQNQQATLQAREIM